MAGKALGFLPDDVGICRGPDVSEPLSRERIDAVSFIASLIAPNLSEELVRALMIKANRDMFGFEFAKACKKVAAGGFK